MSIKDNGEFRHFDRMMRKAEKDGGKNGSRPVSCQQCIFFQPNFKYRKCFFAECYYKKDVDVFRRKPLSKDRFSKIKQHEALKFHCESR
ncbi:MAG: hypothetical protein LUC98_04355 [Lachnospiraceae bacterium]|nr:hypothetical protein [Lachnospiraceae bacterium]